MTEVHVKHGDLLNDFQAFQQGPDPEAFDGPIGQMEQVLGELAVGAFVDPVTNDPFPPNGSGQLIQNVHDELVRLARQRRRGLPHQLPQRHGGQDRRPVDRGLGAAAEPARRAVDLEARPEGRRPDRPRHDRRAQGRRRPRRDGKGSTDVFGAIVDVAGIVLPGRGHRRHDLHGGRHRHRPRLPRRRGRAADVSGVRSPRSSRRCASRSAPSARRSARRRRTSTSSLRGVQAAVLGHRARLRPAPSRPWRTPGNGHDQFGDNY